MSLAILKDLKNPIFFVTNDVARGIGLEEFLPNYHIICLDDHPLVDILQKKGVSVFCLEQALQGKNTIFRSSALILEHPLVLSFIKEKSQNTIPNILFFKPSKKIELVAQKMGFNLIGNTSQLARVYEDKLSFFKIGEKEKLPILFSEVTTLQNINFNETKSKFGLPFVLQFGFGWAGSSTFFINSTEDLKKISRTNQNIKVKISKFIEGITVVNNAVVYQNKILQSPAAIQIMACSALTSTQAGTGGRQWPAPVSLLQAQKIKEITEKMGQIMAKNKYRGFFGLDFIIDKQTEEVYLSENNARLTASTSFYTKLEIAQNKFPLLGYHLLSFLKENVFEIEPVCPNCLKINGGEIVARNTQTSSVVINTKVPVGLYGLDLSFKEESSYLPVTKELQFWLTTAASGRRVNPEIEIIRLNTLEKVCDQNGKINDQYLKIITDVKKKLTLSYGQK